MKKSELRKLIREILQEQGEVGPPRAGMPNKARPRIPNKGNLVQMQSAVQGFINDPGYRQLPEPIKKALKELLEAIINEL